MNNLLENINLTIEFNSEKQFINIVNNGNELKYEMLSSGQKTLLSAIFKLSILLHRGESDGIIICDEGVNNLDITNLNKLITICKTLPFQVFLIYQNIPQKLINVKYINVVRRNNESKIE